MALVPKKILEEIPEISDETFNRHEVRLSTNEAYQQFLRGTFEDLYTHNPRLFAIIEEVAKNREGNPWDVREAAYIALNMVNDQLKAKMSGK